jgi:hypothetical protein
MTELHTIIIPDDSEFKIIGIPNKDKTKLVEWGDSGKELYRAIKTAPEAMRDALEKEMFKDTFCKNYSISQLEKMKEISKEGGGFYFHINYVYAIDEAISLLKSKEKE